MTDRTLHYIYDPLCGWCYAAAPMIEAVRNAGVPVTLHSGGLWDAPTHLGDEKSRYIRENDQRIAALTGLHFGAPYFDGLLTSSETVLWSHPTIAAVLAAGAIEAGAEFAMLRAIQDAHYVSGRHVVDPLVLADLAEDVGLDRPAFDKAFIEAPAESHIGQTRQWMQQIGQRGFPGFLLERNSALLRVQHEPFYGRSEAFAVAVVEMAARSSAA